MMRDRRLLTTPTAFASPSLLNTRASLLCAQRENSSHTATFPIARHRGACILRPVVQRFSQSENLFTRPGEKHGREEDGCEKGRREEGRREEILGEERRREEGWRQEGREVRREEDRQEGREARAECGLHEGDDPERPARRGGR